MAKDTDLDRPESASARWRWLAMLPLPCVAAFALKGSAVSLGEEDFPLLLPRTPQQALSAALLIGVALLSAGLVWSRSRARRVVGYVGYSIALSLGLAVGAVLAVVNEVGGAAGEPRGGHLATVLLTLGSLCSGAGLLPLAAVAFSDWKRARRSVDVPR